MTEHPTAACTSQRIVEAFADRDTTFFTVRKCALMMFVRRAQSTSDVSTAFLDPDAAYRTYATISASCSFVYPAAAGGCFHVPS